MNHEQNNRKLPTADVIQNLTEKIGIKKYPTDQYESNVDAIRADLEANAEAGLVISEDLLSTLESKSNKDTDRYSQKDLSKEDLSKEDVKNSLSDIKAFEKAIKDSIFESSQFDYEEAFKSCEEALEQFEE